MAVFTTAFFVSLAVSTALSFASVLLRPKPKKPDAASLDFSQTISMTLDYDVPKEVLVGRRATGGMGAYIDAHGTKNESLVRVQVVSAKPCSAFHEAIYDGSPVTISGDPTTGLRNVTSHFLGRNNVPRVQVRVYLGHNNAGLGSFLSGLTAGAFSATDNFTDCCVIVQVFRNTNDDFDDDNGENYIPFQGVPRGVFELDGVKVCDPRIAGSSYEDESTYVFSDNPALIDAQYDFGWYSGVGENRRVIVGYEYAASQIPTAEVIANANYCDTKGYVCAGRVRSQNQNDKIEILKTFNAVRVRTGAQVYALPEGRRPPVVTIDFNDHPSARIVSANRQGYSPEVYNGIRTYYAEPAEQYGKKDLPIRAEQTLIDEDNGLIRETKLELNFCTNGDAAIDLEEEELMGSRAAGTVTAADLPPKFGSNTVLPEGSRVRFLNTPVKWLNGLTFYAISKARGADLDVTLACREYAGDPTYAGVPEPVRPVIPITIPPIRPWIPRINPGVPDNVLSDIGRVDADVLGIIAGTRSINDVVITGRGSLIAENEAQNENINVALSAASSAGGGSLTTTKSPNSAFGSGQNTITTNSITVTASGGIGPYTYAWTKVSGDTFTIGSPSSASTNFSAQPGPYNEMSAVYKCTVTDANSDTFAMNVNVTAYDTTDFGNGGGFEP